ncbi:MAG: glycerophosphodiester phosphodiesterase family protein, partial [Chloroflexota bacterium]
LAQIKELDAGYHWSPDEGLSYPVRGKRLTIPTLKGLFEAFPRMRFNIDIKQKMPSIIRPFAELIRNYRKQEEVLVGSFHAEVIDAFRKEIPEVVTAAHKRGLDVHVWTINEPHEMQQLIEIGVDGIFTDYPSRLLQLLSDF